MAGKSDQTGSREPVIRAVVRRYPLSEFAIRKLMTKSEAFCEMCEELAESEMALYRVSELPPDIRETRRAEWQALVDLLSSEVETALREEAARQRPLK